MSITYSKVFKIHYCTAPVKTYPATSSSKKRKIKEKIKDTDLQSLFESGPELGAHPLEPEDPGDPDHGVAEQQRQQQHPVGVQKSGAQSPRRYATQQLHKAQLRSQRQNPKERGKSYTRKGFDEKRKEVGENGWEMEEDEPRCLEEYEKYDERKVQEIITKGEKELVKERGQFGEFENKRDSEDDGRTHAGRSRESCGGVGRNIANALISLGLNATRLISVVGNDQPGKAIIKSLGDGAQTVEQLSNMNTARCTVIINYKGECQFSIGEMEVFASISPDVVKKYQSCVENSSFIILDGNLPLDTIRYVLDLAACSKIPGR
ncbi:putative sugar kinase YeiI [Melipona quadrifasciata]|uniref:Putative sugar kinase YeiI n=1 Tax=Melipona quadrifasciata TaxID=166423 RepID=A0A0M9A8Q6_9HYME|nr:putative sugar kinase YeiI [Melipona quadrifasciata]